MIEEAQNRVFSLIGRMISSGTLPPSLLFTGPEGSGKELAAVGLAAKVNCIDPGGSADCSACAKVRRLEHPDVHLIYPVPYSDPDKSMPIVIESRRENFFNCGEFGNKARSIGIGSIRRIIETLSKQPYEGKRAVVILFEAHLATVEAQNAFLKLLEEPPPSAVLVLVTGFSDRLLPTILSRCQAIRFDPLPAGMVAGFLERFNSLERKEARRLALLAGGNVRRGMRLLDARFCEIRDDAVSLLGLVLDGKVKELVGESEAIAGRYTRDEVGELIEETTILLRDLMRVEDLSGEERKLIEKVFGAKRISAAAGRDIAADLRKIGRLGRALRRNVDIELTLSQLLLDLAGKWY